MNVNRKLHPTNHWPPFPPRKDSGKFLENMKHLKLILTKITENDDKADWMGNKNVHSNVFSDFYTLEDGITQNHVLSINHSVSQSVQTVYRGSTHA